MKKVLLALSIALVVLIASLFAGGVAAVGGLRLSAGLGGLIGLLLLYFSASTMKVERRDLWFWALLILIPIQSMLLGVTGIRLTFLIEVVLLVSLPLTIWGARRFFGAHPALQVALALLVGYLCIALLSSVIGRSSLVPLVYQIATNFKFLFVLLLGFYLPWTATTERAFLRFVQWFWVVLAPLVAVQLLAPSAFAKIMPFAAQAAGNDLLSTSKAVGVFRHPSYLGFYAACLMLISIVVARTLQRKSFYLWATAYFALLILSGQRHEMLTGFLLAFAALVISGPRVPQPSRLIVAACGVALAAGIVSFVFWDYFYAVAEKMALVGTSAPNQPRSVLYADSLFLAQRYFPFGSGLGTFGSAAAVKFDPSLYLELGYGGFGWFGTNVLSDTYWPQHLAETGFAGLALTASIMLIFVLVALRSIYETPAPRDRFYWTSAFLSLSLMLSISLASPIIEDPGLSLIPFVLFSVALRRRISAVRSNEQRDVTTTSARPETWRFSGRKRHAFGVAMPHTRARTQK